MARLIRLLTIIFALLLNHPAHSEKESLPWKDMPMVGKSSLNVFFMDIYTAELFAPQKTFSFDEEYALKIAYQRDFSKASLIKETRKQFEHLGLDQEPRISNWLDKLDSVWVDVEEGDSLTLYVDESGDAIFYHNQKLLGAITDPELARSFASIWLSENTSRPNLRKQLLGGQS